MEKRQKSKSGSQQSKAANQGDVVVNPGNKPRVPGGPRGDIPNAAPAPGTSRDPLVHPGDEQDITPDVIADKAVSGQGNAKP
jgi:hypothetical protein